MSRRTRVSRTVTAGCFTCWGSNMRWHGPNSQGVAAKHHDSTGHTTWVDVGMSIRYGEDDGGGSSAALSLPFGKA